MEDSATQKRKPQTVTTSEEASKGELKDLTVDELNILLNEVLDQEDYIRAISIRDELNRRKKNH